MQKKKNKRPEPSDIRYVNESWLPPKTSKSKNIEKPKLSSGMVILNESCSMLEYGKDILKSLMGIKS